ncbi:uncharacterized protein Ecym_5315 [Eremothecium cymbalariae DBVPG|uniref:Uncharacterized protein n=1 Tax=Eremothecium cymbalariae (strain CBS 270.75 / DBVPG 7215 / KCTC 17166 / NRRL Y-17582) TaxID=931890 RepID=I6NDD4_ERECY|nr:hypothetical protein Ecym_5315 [Eremothecium cymbalariae DBVPG\
MLFKNLRVQILSIEKMGFVAGNVREMIFYLVRWLQIIVVAREWFVGRCAVGVLGKSILKDYGEVGLHNGFLEPIVASAQELALRTFYCEGDTFAKVYVRLKALEMTTTTEDLKKILENGLRMGVKVEWEENKSDQDGKVYEAILEEAREAEVADLIAREESGVIEPGLFGSGRNRSSRAHSSELVQDLAELERPIFDVASAYIEALKSLKATFQEPGNVNSDVFVEWLNEWFIKSPLLFRLSLSQIKSTAKRMARDGKYRVYYLNRILTGAWFYVDINLAAQRLFGEYRNGFDDIYPTMYDQFLHSMNNSFIEEFNEFYHRPQFLSESLTDGEATEVLNRMLECSFRGVFALKQPLTACFLGVTFVSAHDECYKTIVNTTHREMVLIYKLITMYMSMKSKLD